MTLDIKFNKIIEEIEEDLETQAGFVLSDTQIKSLSVNHRVVFTDSEIQPYLKDIIKFLAITSPSERVWDCYKILSDNTCVIAIHLESPYIYFSTIGLNE